MFRMPNVRRPVILGAGLSLIILIGAAAFAARQAANAAEPLEGNRLTASDVRILVRAASSCPTLTPARLAGQVMVASNFGDQPVPEMRDGGAVGVAALTPEQWQKYAPSPDAAPTDREDAITALAHAMCQLVGQSRALNIDADPWRVALAAHRLGIDQVIAAGAVPESAADYVETVDRYAAWYALQPAFGGGAAAPAAGDAYPTGGPVVLVPEVYVPMIVAAGKRCPELPPVRIAAQIMVTSGFDPNRLGPAGEQGIAQFLPGVWRTHADVAPRRTPWEPAVAIPALGRAMCKLISQSGGEYGPALAAFTRGDRGAQTPLVEAVKKAQTEYAKDPRLQPPKPPATKPAPSSPAANPTGGNTTKVRDNQPPVKAAQADGSGRSYGPYFILNLRTKLCVDIPGTGAGLRDGPVNQFTCAKNTEDNQEWSFVPRAKDSQGYQLYWIRNVDDGFCIDPPGVGTVANETQLNTTGCFDQDNQYFRLEPKRVSGGFQYYWLRNIVTDMCLEVPGSGTGGPEARLQFVPCLANDDHDWALVEKSEW
jgi:hypothetical protein